MADEAAARDALAGAMAANAQRQTIAREFLAAHGAEVTAGHTMVGTFTPDLGADPDFRWPGCG
jgi:hypothetical protein